MCGVLRTSLKCHHRDGGVTKFYHKRVKWHDLAESGIRETGEVRVRRASREGGDVEIKTSQMRADGRAEARRSERSSRQRS